MRILSPRILLPLLFLVSPLYAARSQGLEMPVIFSDHMVLQQGKPVLIWGRDKPGTELVLRFGTQEKKCRARLNGSWSVKLDALKPGPARELVVKGSSEILIRDVLVGEVWFCSGQSNMEFALSKSTGGKEAIKTAKVDGIRLFKATRRASTESQFDVRGGPWSLATPESARIFSAVAWHFGQQLHKELGVPIGLVQCAWGGTRIQSWMSPNALKNKAFADLNKKWIGYDKRHEAWKKKHDKWKVQSKRAKRAGKEAPKEPREAGRQRAKNRPASLFLGMAGPILPYGYAGAIWYQGEANRKEASAYADYTRTLVLDWRQVSRQDLPFYWVQLASYHYRDLGERGLPLMWEAQDKARDLKRTGMASAVDIGNAKNIHPTNKTEVGRRLSLLALAEVYGKQVESRGPELLRWKKIGKEIHLLFSHCEGGLVAKGTLEGFEVAGSKKKFFPAQARIQGQTIILTCSELKSAKAVRYAFREPCPFPVFNQQGLPLTPFRTDDWQVKGQ